MKLSDQDKSKFRDAWQRAVNSPKSDCPWGFDTQGHLGKTLREHYQKHLDNPARAERFFKNFEQGELLENMTADECIQVIDGYLNSPFATHKEYIAEQDKKWLAGSQKPTPQIYYRDMVSHPGLDCVSDETREIQWLFRGRPQPKGVTCYEPRY